MRCILNIKCVALGLEPGSHWQVMRDWGDGTSSLMNQDLEWIRVPNTMFS